MRSQALAHTAHSGWRERRSGGNTKKCEPKPSHLSGAAAVACLLCFQRGGQRAQSRADVRVEKGHHTEFHADGKFSFMKMASQIRWCILRWLHFIFSLIFCVYDCVPFAHDMSSTAASSPCSPRSSPAFGWCSHSHTVRRSNGHVISTLRHQTHLRLHAERTMEICRAPNIL